MDIPIYVIGSANTDMVVKSEKLPLPGETILGGDFFMNAGGKGANQAVAASRLGGNVTLVANIGEDIFGRQALHQFRQEKINTSFITSDTSHPSGIALINVNSQGENSIVVAPGANAHLSIEHVKPVFESMTSPSIVLLQLEIPLSTVAYVIGECARKNIQLILNPAPATLLENDLLKQVNIITPNEHEAGLLTGHEVGDEASIHQAAQALHKKGIPQVIITLGARGAYLSTPNHAQFIASPQLTAIDTTAAGDCFNGALAVALAERQPLEKAVAFACKAASVSVTRLGAQASMPTRKEVETWPTPQ